MIALLRFMTWPVTLLTGGAVIYSTSDKINRTLMWGALAFGAYAVASGKVKL